MDPPRSRPKGRVGEVMLGPLQVHATNHTHGVKAEDGALRNRQVKGSTMRATAEGASLEVKHGVGAALDERRSHGLSVVEAPAIEAHDVDMGTVTVLHAPRQGLAQVGSVLVWEMNGCSSSCVGRCHGIEVAKDDVHSSAEVLCVAHASINRDHLICC